MAEEAANRKSYCNKKERESKSSLPPAFYWKTSLYRYPYRFDSIRN